MLTFAHGLFGWNTQSLSEVKMEMVTETNPEPLKKVLPEFICLMKYPHELSKGSYTIRKPRRGLSHSDLSHAHLLVTYRECDCFHPTTEDGWVYLKNCVRYFSDIEKGFNELQDIKNEI